jgi:hypothetical protein
MVAVTAYQRPRSYAITICDPLTSCPKPYSGNRSARSKTGADIGMRAGSGTVTNAPKRMRLDRRVYGARKGLGAEVCVCKKAMMHEVGEGASALDSAANETDLTYVSTH